MKVRGLLTWPVLAVAVLALALGSTGTAVAAHVLTKHQVKRIAAHVIKKKAPGLSVAHASTADNATNATNATHATLADSATNATNTTNATNAQHATSADDSAKLGGNPPSTFQSRTAFGLGGGADTSAAGADGVPVVGPVTITVPAGQHFVHLSSSASYVADDGTSTGDVVEYWAVDGDCSDLTGYVTAPVYGQAGGGGSPQTAVPMDYVFNLATGDHTVTICASSDPHVVNQNATLSLQTVNLNGSGGDTLAAKPKAVPAGTHVTTHP